MITGENLQESSTHISELKLLWQPQRGQYFLLHVRLERSKAPIEFQSSFLIHLCSWCEYNLQQCGESPEVRELKITKTCGMRKVGQYKQPGLALHPCKAQQPPASLLPSSSYRARWNQKLHSCLEDTEEHGQPTESQSPQLSEEAGSFQSAYLSLFG